MHAERSMESLEPPGTITGFGMGFIAIISGFGPRLAQSREVQQWFPWLAEHEFAGVLLATAALILFLVGLGAALPRLPMIGKPYRRYCAACIAFPAALIRWHLAFIFAIAAGFALLVLSLDLPLIGRFVAFLRNSEPAGFLPILFPLALMTGSLLEIFRLRRLQSLRGIPA